MLVEDAEGEADDHPGGEATGYSERRLWMFCVSAIYALLLLFRGSQIYLNTYLAANGVENMHCSGSHCCRRHRVRVKEACCTALVGRNSARSGHSPLDSSQLRCEGGWSSPCGRQK